jgi:serine/threonine-protein kinase
MDTKSKIDEALRRKRGQTSPPESEPKSEAETGKDVSPHEISTIVFQDLKPRNDTQAGLISKINERLKRKQTTGFTPVPAQNKNDRIQVSAIDFDKLVGSIIDNRYRILSKIGQGGMGAVFKAEQIHINRLCAIKIINPEFTHNEDALKRFNREAKLCARLNHPHAVTLYDFGEAAKGIYYAAMEYVEGETLSNVMKNVGALPLKRTLEIVRQVGSALEYAHNLKIVHRDLKPENIMIAQQDGRDWAKVLDFGIAKITMEDEKENLTRSGLVLGTPLYISPEQLYGEKVDSRSDLYSFALIVYEMLAGCLPFKGESTQAIMMKRLNQEPMRIKEVNSKALVPAGVEKVLMAALSRNLESRIATVQRFVEELERSVSV